MWIRKAVLGCLAILLQVSGLHAAPPSHRAAITDGLVAYMPFDGDLTVKGAIGFKIPDARDPSYAEGIWGKGIVAGDAGVALHGWRMLKEYRGSIAFWVKPDWSGQDRSVPERTLLDSGVDNFQVVYEPGHAAFFMTGDTRGKDGFNWDYLDTKALDSWQPGQWHHVAVTWNAASGDKALYVDGQRVADDTTVWIVHQFGGTFRIGSSSAPGVYDEWLIWNRQLSDDEIRLLASCDEGLRRALQLAPPQPEEPAKFPLAFPIKQVSFPDAIVAPGEAFTARVPVRNRGKTLWRGTVRFTLLDFWEKPRASQTVQLALRPGEEKEVAVAFEAPGNGVFKISARTHAGERTWEGDVASFAGWPRPTASGDRSDSFFGTHINSWDENELRQGARLGQVWNRWTEGTFWTKVQPEPGEFRWLDADHISNNRKHGFSILGLLIATPYWALARGPAPAPKAPTEGYPYFNDPPDLAKYRNYVYQTVSHYKNDIHCWEIGNEPEVWMEWDGTPEQFAALARAAYEEMKTADPHAIALVSGFGNGDWAWHEAAARAGLFRSADAVSFHWYDDGSTPDQRYEEGKEILAHFDRLVKEYGPGHPLPYWITEAGVTDDPWLRNLDFPGLPPEPYRAPPNWRQAALAMVQDAAVAQALGIVRYFTYFQNGTNPDVGAFGALDMLDVTNAPRPKLMSWVVMEKELEGLEFAGLVRRPEGHFWASVYRAPGSGDSVLLWWTGRQTKAKIVAGWPGKLVQAVDMMGNPHKISFPLRVTDEPSYLHIAAPAEAVVAALRKARIEVIQ